MATNEEIGIRVSREGAEQAIILSEPAGEQALALGSESISVRSVRSYEQLDDLPQINDVTLIGNKSFEDLQVTRLSNLEIETIINSVV